MKISVVLFWQIIWWCWSEWVDEEPDEGPDHTCWICLERFVFDNVFLGNIWFSDVFFDKVFGDVELSRVSGWGECARDQTRHLIDALRAWWWDVVIFSIIVMIIMKMIIILQSRPPNLSFLAKKKAKKQEMADHIGCKLGDDHHIIIVFKI